MFIKSYFHLFYCSLTSLLFSYALEISFLTFFLLPIPLSIPLFRLSRAVRFTKKQRWNKSWGYDSMYL